MESPDHTYSHTFIRFTLWFGLYIAYLLEIQALLILKILYEDDILTTLFDYHCMTL